MSKPRGIITKVAPQYPQIARAEHLEGTVKMHALIDKDGKTVWPFFEHLRYRRVCRRIRFVPRHPHGHIHCSTRRMKCRPGFRSEWVTRSSSVSRSPF